MALTLTQSSTAVAVNCPASFLASGGTGPYIYAVLPGGAGGSINALTGEYTAPTTVSPNPAQLYDTIQATDSLAVTGTAQILVGTPLLLFCEIIQKEMNLPSGRVYLWDQKIMQPTDFNLYIAVSVSACKPFGSSNRTGSIIGGLEATQFVSMHATVDIDIISRGPAARDRKEEVILALNSIYAQQQQDANSFYIGKLSTGFINLSQVDGAAIPYRYRISVAMQYAVAKVKSAPYFDDFTDDLITDP